MAKFFSLQLRRSICRSVLFTVFWELSIVNKCTSNQEICINSNRRSISYFQADVAESTWFTAWQKCNNLTSTLPIICDESEHGALMSFLNSHKGISSVWTSGQKINFTEWTWIDGHIHRGMAMLSAQHGTYTHVALDGNFDFFADHPQHRNFYLCQYSGSRCRSGDVALTNHRCVRPSVDSRTWFHARNHCIRNGGDLAILYGDDLAAYKKNMLHAADRYWIGLRKNTWHWRNRASEPLGHSGEEIKYTNWLNDPLYGDCISINVSTGQWNVVSCTDKKMVVCQSRADERTSSTSSEMATSRLQSSSATNETTPSWILRSFSRPILDATTNTMLSMSESETQRMETVVSQAAFITAVVVGLGVVIISNIIVALVVRKYYLRRADPASSNIAATGTECYQDLKTTRGQANPDGTYAELQLQTVYEEVSQRGH